MHKVKYYYTTLLMVLNGEDTYKMVFLQEVYLLFQQWW